MKKELIRKVLKIMIVILILFVLVKLYHFMIVKHLFDAITEFKNEENRAYFVNTVMSENMVLEEKVFLKQETIKYISKESNVDLIYEWREFRNNEEYFFDVNSKKIYTKDTYLTKNFLPDIPECIGYSYGEEFKPSAILAVHHIIPTRYNDKFCYKIITKNEVIIIDKDTYLPVYSSMKTVKTDSKNKIEKTYEFKVGEVTDEEVALPDLSEYTIVE